MNGTIRVGNTDIGPTSDLVMLLRRQLMGGTPLSGRYDETPEQGALSLFRALKDTELEGRAADAITQLLTDPNLDVRAGAVAVVEDFPEFFDNSSLLELLEENAKLFEGVGSNHFGRKQPDLAWALLRAMAATPARTYAVTNRLRLASQDERNGGRVLAGVATNDTDWILDHPAETVRGDPTRAWIILLNLDQPTRERFVRMLPKESPGLNEAVKIGVERAVRDQHQRDRLMQLLTT